MRLNLQAEQRNKKRYARKEYEDEAVRLHGLANQMALQQLEAIYTFEVTRDGRLNASEFAIVEDPTTMIALAHAMITAAQRITAHLTDAILGKPTENDRTAESLRAGAAQG